MKKPPIEVDWTQNPKSGSSNSSPEFERLVAEVARLIRGEAHSLLNGRVEDVAVLIMAQLAHVHGLAPRRVDVQSVESGTGGVVCGMFLWNGVAYRYEAKPLNP